MSKTNHELARAAAEKLSDVQYCFNEEVAEIIRDTYAEAMAPKWIACSERMPELQKDVAFTDGKRRYVGWLTVYGDWHCVLSSAHYDRDRIKMWHELPTLPEPPEVTK